MNNMCKFIFVLVLSAFIFICLKIYQSGQPIIDYNLKPSSYQDYKNGNPGDQIPEYCFDIYSSSYCEGFQIIYSFLRVTVPENKLEDASDFFSTRIFNNSKGKLIKTPETNHLVFIPDALKPLSWWNVAEIEKGYSIECEDRPGPVIFVDEKRSVIYIYYTQ